MTILKIVEITASSTISWEDAAQQAVNEASKSLKNIRSVHVKDHSAVIKNNKIVEYRLTAKLSFEITQTNKVFRNNVQRTDLDLRSHALRKTIS